MDTLVKGGSTWICRVAGRVFGAVWGHRDDDRARARGWPLGSNRWRMTLMATVVLTGTGFSGWPAFLPPPGTLPPEVSTDVERVWRDPTFVRSIQGRPVSAPLDIYLALLDAPDVTARAASFLKVAKHRVRVVGDDWFEGEDGSGAHGFYRVLVRTPDRRVFLAWGENEDGVLGMTRGSALSVLEFKRRDGKIDQELTAYVWVDRGLVAVLTRVFLPIFGSIADRKLSEGMTMAGVVAEWAVARPAEFCAWLEGEPLAPERSGPIRAIVYDRMVAGAAAPSADRGVQAP